VEESSASVKLFSLNTNGNLCVSGA